MWTQWGPTLKATTSNYIYRKIKKLQHQSLFFVRPHIVGINEDGQKENRLYKGSNKDDGCNMVHKVPK